MGDQENPQGLKTCPIENCANVFSTEIDLVLHITAVHGAAGPAVAAHPARA